MRPLTSHSYEAILGMRLGRGSGGDTQGKRTKTEMIRRHLWYIIMSSVGKFIQT